MTEQELSTHLCGWCKDRSEEERERLAIFHAGQCWTCREEHCPLFGRPIAVGMFGKHEAGHKDLPVTVAPVPAVVETSVETSTADAISPEKKAELEVNLEKALPELDKTLRDLEEAKRPNPDLNGMVFGGTGTEDIAKSPALSVPLTKRDE